MLKPAYHNLRRAAARIWLKRFPRAVQVGVTGSYGKTSTTSAIYAVLSRHSPTLMTDLNLDTIYNVPITALKLRPQHRHVVFEMGIDSPGEMDFHLEIARPRISVVTGITPVHADREHVGSLEAIIQQKGRIIEVLPPEGVAILNHDDTNVRSMAPRAPGRVLFYGTSPVCDYAISRLQVSLKETRFLLTTPRSELEIRTPLLGAHNALNLSAAAAVAQEVGVPDDRIQEAFAGLEPLEGRFNIAPGPGGLTLINDALRANPASTRAGLEYLGALTDPQRKIAVLGEMGELGDYAVAEHVSVGETAASVRPDLLITVGYLTRHTAEAALQAGLPEARVHAVENVHAAAAILQERAEAGDIIYLKGSLMRHMERIPMILAGARVGCSVVSCPFYHQCTACGFLEVGYNPEP